jgi:hypothetical protein
MIHFLMGNERWMLKHIDSIAKNTAVTFIELGAGDGSFCRILLKRYPNATIHAYDLQHRPAALADAVQWHSGDICQATPPSKRDDRPCILLSSMFLHHFTDEQLAIFRPWVQACDHAFIIEPWRHKAVALLGAGLYPLCNDVTRHDMRVSIHAGFCGSELAEKILPNHSWTHETSHYWRGAYRVVFHRRETH